MTGMPAQNDSFSIARSRTEDMFTTLGNLADGARILDDDAGRARALQLRHGDGRCSSSTRPAITC